MIRIRSKTKTAVLNYFFLNEDASVYIHELARILDIDPKTVYWALQGLEKDGLLKSEFKAKERYFSLNKNQPLLTAYQEIFSGSYGIENALKQAVIGIKGIDRAVLFGSYARGEMTGASDIDLLLIGGHSPLQAQKKIYPLQKKFGRDINVVHMSVEDWNKKKASKDQFVRQILSEPHIRLL